MDIQVNTDHNVAGSEALTQMVEAEVRSGLERFAGRLTRVEVHLGDENAEKDGGGADKRCMLEARPAGMQPVVVNHHADRLEEAVAGAHEEDAPLAGQDLWPRRRAPRRRDDPSGRVALTATPLGPALRWSGED